MIQNRWQAMRAAARVRTIPDVHQFERVAACSPYGRAFVASPDWAAVRESILPTPASEWATRSEVVFDLESAERLMLAAAPSREGRAFLLSAAWCERVMRLLQAQAMVPA